MDQFPVTLTEAVGLCASLAFSGIFYYLYKKSQTTVDKLKNAPRLPIDEKLKCILQATPEACLHYVVIEGSVEPVDKHVRSQFHNEVIGVLQRITLNEHRMVWSRVSNIWMDEQRILHQSVNVLPFLLVGPDRTAVKVVSPLQASGEYTEVTYEKFQQASYSFLDLLGHNLSGVKPKGHLEIEEMLKVGTVLTGVGELRLDQDGTISLRPPSQSSQYFLTKTDFEALQSEQENMAAGWKALAVAFALAGSAVLLWAGLRYYRHLRIQWEQEQERKEFARRLDEAARQRANESRAEPQLDGETGSTENVCVICVSQPRNCIFLNCGHVCCCYVCFQALPQRKCPICRQDIIRVLPLYQS